MKSVTRYYSNEIDQFATNSLYERAKVYVQAFQTVTTQSKGNEIFRIIHSAGRTFISVQEKHMPIIQEHVRTNDIIENFVHPIFIARYLIYWAIILANFYWNQAKSFCKISITIAYICWTTFV